MDKRDELFVTTFQNFSEREVIDAADKAFELCVNWLGSKLNPIQHIWVKRLIIWMNVSVCAKTGHIDDAKKTVSDNIECLGHTEMNEVLNKLNELLKEIEKEGSAAKQEQSDLDAHSSTGS